MIGLVIMAATLNVSAQNKTLKNTDMNNLKEGKNEVIFRSQGVNLAGNLYLPPGFDTTKKYETIVFAGPFNQVKEQMAAVYGEKLTAKGYVYLSFDHFGYGDSEGIPRNAELVGLKVEGIRNAISFLRTLPFVDREQLFGIGGCAGSQHITIVAASDTRLKAYATVSGMMSNYFYGQLPKEVFMPMLTAANEARQRQYETGKVEYYDALGYDNFPEELKANNEGYDYYMTARAGKETYPNYTNHTIKTLVEDNLSCNTLVYTPHLFNPYLGIIGENTLPKEGEQPTPLHTGPLTTTFYDAVTLENKELFVIKNASHVDLYDQEEFVNQAVDKIDEFFKKSVK